MNDEQEPPRLSLLQMLASTVAAAFGVQSAKNRERDASRGRAGQFIALGVGATIAFVLLIVLVVNLVLPST